MSEQDFRDLCETFKINVKDQRWLKDNLDLQVEIYNDEIAERQIGFSMDHDTLKVCLRNVRSARMAIGGKALGKAAKNALGFHSSRFANLPSPYWLLELFPRHPALTGLDRKLAQLSDNRLRRPFGHGSFGVRSLIEKTQNIVVGHDPRTVIVEMLGELENALDLALRTLPLMPGAKGGAPSKDFRKYVVANLASWFWILGRETKAGLRSDFLHFCENVFDAMGWKSHKSGLKAVIPKALKLSQKTPSKIRVVS